MKLKKESIKSIHLVGRSGVKAEKKTVFFDCGLNRELPLFLKSVENS